MDALTRIGWIGFIALALAVSGCGGGGGGDTQPAGTVVGAAGGTVTGPNGAKVEIPAGALASDTMIAIEESSAGAPTLPAGFSARGPMFAFTPHGTAFAVPVTLTLPLDGAAVPAGMTPTLYKTNGQNQWERVSNATFGSDSVSAQITSFSNGQTGVELVQCPKREWIINPTSKAPNWGFPLSPSVIDEQTCGEVKVPFLFGAADPTFEQDNGDTPGLATGEVYSNPTGESFSAYAEAPIGDPNLPEFRSGGEAVLRQFQSYVKRAPDATLRLILSAGFLAAVDFNGRPLSIECNGTNLDTLSDEAITKFCLPILTGVEFKVVAFTGSPIPGKREFFSTHGEAVLRGFDGKWKFFAHSIAESGTPLWAEANFTALELDGNRPLAALNGPLIIDIDLSSIDICPPDQAAIFCSDKAFTIFSFVRAEAWNWRGRESGAAAFLRDPQEIGGTALQMAGLEATNNPLPLPSPELAPIACASGRDPAAGVLQFSAASYSAPEGTGTRGMQDIMVTRTQGSKGAVSVNFSAAGGSAVSAVDYELPAVTVRFADGDTAPRLVKVNLLANTLVEPDKTVNLTLSDPGGCAALGQQATAILTIQDDDGAPPPPPTSFKIGGTVSGLAGSGLVLRNIGSNDFAVTGNGPFTFSIPIANGVPYSVAVAMQPTNPAQICTVTNGSGTVTNAAVANVAVDCVTPPPPGGVDPTFGSGGKVSTAFGGAETAMALQADGKIVMVGGSPGDFVLARYNLDGSLDSSFGAGGLVTTDFLGNVSGNDAHGVAIQADGKIVVAGQAVVGRTANNLSNFDFALARYNADGSLDASFGSGGKVTTDFNGGADRAFALAIQPDGKIVVVGDAGFSSPIGGSVDFGIARYNANGTLDATFGNGGKLRTDIAGGIDIAHNVVVLPANGAILVSGAGTSAGDAGLDHTGLARYDTHGVLDGSFGTGGKLTLNDKRVNEGLVLQGDGKILLAGSVSVGIFPARSSHFALMRLAANGSPDNGFGNAGLVLTDFTSVDDFGRAVALQADARIVVAGQSSNQSNPNFGVVRYATDGTLDTSFGTGGKLTIDFFGSFDGAENVAVQPDGKIVLGGFARNGTRTGYGLVRVLP